MLELFERVGALSQVVKLVSRNRVRSNSKPGVPVPSRRSASVLVVFALLGAGVTFGRNRSSRNPEDLFIVDCRLPGEVRVLGRRTTYVTPRRLTKTTTEDCRLRGGEFTARDLASYQVALETWRPLAESGDALAQTYVGEIYERGVAGTPDFSTAAEWYRRAADQQLARAQVNLGNLYEKGLGVPENKAKALEYYRLATGLQGSFVLAADVAAQQAALAELERELERARTELSETKTQAENARSEAARLGRELARLRELLGAAPPGQRAETRRQVEQLSAEASSLEHQLVQRENQRGTLETLVARLEQSIQRNTAAQGSAAALPIAAPSIQIVEPDVLVTRGVAITRSALGTETRIVGRVDAPAGLGGLEVNGAPLVTNAAGLFEHRIVPRSVRTEVHFRATDRAGRRTDVELVVIGGESTLVASDHRAQRPSPTPAPTVAGPFLALLIGNENYAQFPRLGTAHADVGDIAALLQAGYGFKVDVLLDASQYSILRKLDDLRRTAKGNENVLIYYAGHGKLDERTGLGYWVPVDAERDEPSRWIPNSALADILNAIPARRILVVADSCYAGTFSRSAVARVETGDEAQLVGSRLRTRIVLTSGGVQPVLDDGGGGHSVFATAFLSVLRLNQGTLSGAGVHREVKARVAHASARLGLAQQPEYAPARHSGHEGGEFFFVKRAAN